jgi:hypothetical protein
MLHLKWYDNCSIFAMQNVGGNSLGVPDVVKDKKPSPIRLYEPLHAECSTLCVTVIPSTINQSECNSKIIEALEYALFAVRSQPENSIKT